jgi:disulfide bond formation protein DsbB
MVRWITPPRAIGLIFAVSIVVLGAALLSQYVGGLEPCVLCLYQRVPYVLTIVLSGAALAFATIMDNEIPAMLVRVALFVCAILFLIGAGTAAYHVGVEQGWWQGTEACSGPDLNSLTAAELREQLLQTPVTRCDEVAWSAFGISMAGYNFIVSLFLASGSLWLARALIKRAEPA